MSYELRVYTPGNVRFTAEELSNNMEVLRWQIRLLNDDDVVVTVLEEAATVIAWDYMYEPASVFEERYVSGVSVDFRALPDDEVHFLGACGIDFSVIPVSDINTDELRHKLDEEQYARFTEWFDTDTVRAFDFRTGASSDPYRFLLQTDLATMTAWMTTGLLHDPQDDTICFLDDPPSAEITPVERALKHAEEMEAIWADDTRRAALIAEWLSPE